MFQSPCQQVDATTIEYSKDIVLAACAERIAELTPLAENARAKDKEAMDVYNKTIEDKERARAEKKEKAKRWEKENGWRWFSGENPFAEDYFRGDYNALMEKWRLLPFAAAPEIESEISVIQKIQTAAGGATGAIMLSLDMAEKVFTKKQ